MFVWKDNVPVALKGKQRNEMGAISQISRKKSVKNFIHTSSADTPYNSTVKITAQKILRT